MKDLFKSLKLMLSKRGRAILQWRIDLCTHGVEYKWVDEPQYLSEVLENKEVEKDDGDV